MSPRAACRLESLGFTPIYDYVAGLADWTANGLPTEGRLASVLRAGDVVRQDTPTCRLTERLGDAQERARAAEQNVCVVTTENGVVLGRIRGEALEGDAVRSSVTAIVGLAICLPCLLVLLIGAGIGTVHVFPRMSEGIKLAAQSFARNISVISCCVE